MDFNGREMLATLTIAKKPDGSLAGKWGSAELSDVKPDGGKLAKVRNDRFGLHAAHATPAEVCCCGWGSWETPCAGSSRGAGVSAPDGLSKPSCVPASKECRACEGRTA